MKLLPNQGRKRHIRGWTGAGYAKILIATLVIMAIVQGVHAQETSYGLLWSYEIGESVNGVSVSSDGSYIAAGSGDLDNTVYFFNREGKLLWSYKMESYLDQVFDVSVSSDGQYIAAVSWDIYFFNKEGKLLWRYNTSSTVKTVSASFDGSYIAAGSSDGKIYLFNREGKLLWSYTLDWDVLSVSVSSDGSYIAAGSRGIYFFNRDASVLWKYETGGPVSGISVSSDGSYITAGSYNEDGSFFGKVHLFNRDGKLLWNYTTGNGVMSVSLSSDSSYIAAGSLDKKVYLFDRGGKLLWSYNRGYNVNSVSISSDGSYLSAGSADGYVYAFVSSEALPPVTAIPTPTSGSISVSSTPSGASIYLNGTSEGITPKIISDVSAGYHRVELKLDGYNLWSDSINVVAGSTAYVSALLMPVTPTVTTKTPASTSAKTSERQTPAPPPTTAPSSVEPETNWMMVGGISASILLIIIAILRTKKGNLVIRRTVYNPVSKGFVSEKKLSYPEVSNWLSTHPPPDYWYILRIDNHGSTVEQWAVELETQKAVSVKEAYIDGNNFTSLLQKEESSMQKDTYWKNRYIFTVPKEKGQTLPSNGVRRLYFRLNIDCNVVLQSRYTISGRLITKGITPIPEKDFPFSCDIKEIKKIHAKEAQTVEKYITDRAKEYEPIKRSHDKDDMRRAAYYCCELFLLHLNLQKAPDALKYCLDMLNYASGETREEVEKLAKNLEFKLKNHSDISEDFLEKAEVVTHQVRMGWE